MELQNTVYYIGVISAVIILFLLFVNAKLRKYDPLTKPKGIVTLAIWAVQMVYDMVLGPTDEKVAKALTPYIISVGMYIFLSNIAGLFALESPTSNLSVTLALGAVTCVLIEYFSLKERGLKDYGHTWIEPLPVLLPINIISKISTLASLALRLFGNIIAGSILMSVIYQLLALISSMIPVVGQFNIVGVIIAPVLHAYFDIFSGAMQTFIFVMLTISFIGKELPKEDN